jgi:hypothetical protein
MDLKEFYVRMELEDFMGVIKNIERFSKQIIERIEK